jgi:hypothetical protein
LLGNAVPQSRSLQLCAMFFRVTFFEAFVESFTGVCLALIFTGWLIHFSSCAPGENNRQGQNQYSQCKFVFHLSILSRMFLFAVPTVLFRWEQRRFSKDTVSVQNHTIIHSFSAISTKKLSAPAFCSLAQLRITCCLRAV